MDQQSVPNGAPHVAAKALTHRPNPAATASPAAEAGSPWLEIAMPRIQLHARQPQGKGFVWAAAVTIAAAFLALAVVKYKMRPTPIEVEKIVKVPAPAPPPQVIKQEVVRYVHVPAPAPTPAPKPPEPPPTPPAVAKIETSTPKWAGLWRDDKAAATIRLADSPKGGVTGFYSGKNSLQAAGNVEEARVVGDSLTFFTHVGIRKYGFRLERLSEDSAAVYRWIDADGLNEEYRKVDGAVHGGRVRVSPQELAKVRQEIKAAMKIAGDEVSMGVFKRTSAGK